ncbi:MAG: hypothetical protein IJS61_11055 [Firmicutes bacterium]|nr:hypothetical protein [Bacillota bacterium]
MFNFKNELSKFDLLPELDISEERVNDNNVEDIMDILKTFAEGKNMNLEAGKESEK